MRLYVDWTTKLTDKFVAMVMEGAPDSSIARRLCLTRNQVIGKRHRLGLRCGGDAPAPGTPRAREVAPLVSGVKVSPSRSGKGRAPRQFSRIAPASAPLSAKLLRAFESPPPAPAGPEKVWPRVDLLGLTQSMCRWPFGEPRDIEAFRYCGSPKEVGPYCSVHSGLAYTPRGADKMRRDAARGGYTA